MTRSEYMLSCAECALSPERAERRANALFKIAPNPTDHGRVNQKADWLRYWRDYSRGLIWC